MLRNGKLNTEIFSIYLILFITFFYHLNAFLYNPRIIMYILMIVGVVLLYRSMGGIRKKLDFIEVCCLLTLIPYFLNNQDIKRGSYDQAIPQIMMVIVFLLLSRKDTWFSLFGIFVKKASMIMVFFTALFIIIPSLKNVILPIVFPGNTTILTTNAAVGLTHHYSANGNFMALALGASVWLYDSKERSYWVRIIVTFVCLLMTLKRGPLIWCAAGLLVSYYVFNSDKKSSRLFKVIALLLSALILVNVLSDFVPQVRLLMDRFQMTDVDDGGVTFLSGREVLYEAAWILFRQNPIWGVGWGGYAAAASQYTGYEMMTAHNIYLQLLAETGVVGFSIYVLYFISAVILGVKCLGRARKQIIQTDEQTERLMAFSLFVIIYYITYGMSGLVLEDVMLIYMFMFSIAVFRNANELQRIQWS